ncbi:MAG: tRNA dihydrouridine synthase DusB [Gammaproteobacteria bacterium]|nr:tRNA dihydrouridine synthase DusB [Gammaproteobacteria bacterium]
MRIGPYTLDNNLLLAPMAGVTDKPFRQLCKMYGAGLAVSEMVASDPTLWNSKKSLLRLNHYEEESPRTVQIVGADPQAMANAAQYNVDLGAQIIDINMGCPARKVCNVFSGSALMQDETLVASILESVVDAVDVPVTLKIRTGWNKQNKNAVKIAQIAENSGIQMLTVHGRTRACGFSGDAEYRTIREVKAHVSIPVIANGDINTPEKAVEILNVSGTDGIMLGRAALGNPWIFNEINHFLKTGTHLSRPRVKEIQQVMLQHLNGLYELYGEYTGVRVARKHVGWYSKHLQSGEVLRSSLNKTETVESQLLVIENYFNSINDGEALAA